MTLRIRSDQAPDGWRQKSFDLVKGLDGTGSVAGGLVFAWVAWSVLDLVMVDLAYGEEVYRYRIDVIGWKRVWPLLRWVPGWMGLVAAFIQALRRPSIDGSRHRSCLWLVGMLCGLRLISLVPGVGTVAPVLGVLWSGHVSWALSLSLPVYLVYPELNAGLASRNRTAGSGLALCFAILYLAYAVFFVRTTLLHGDETQYMMIAQSLVRDGDINLSNTTQASALEFHELPNVFPRRAPASPPGVIHPTHPIGLSLLLAPAFWLGLSFDHPRLPCALLVSIIAVLVLFLTHRWLVRLGITPAGALITTIGVGSSPLLFLYSNQLYPDVFAVAGTLGVLILLAGPVVEEGGQTRLFLSSFVAITLPMLHPRLLPLAGLLGIVVIFRVRSMRDPSIVVKDLVLMTVAGVVGYALYHLHYSGDIWGAFKPGNAWEANVIDFGDLPVALCGQWLDGKIGLLNNSPIFVGTLIGVAAMVSSRDRLLLLAIGIYGASACVNALSIDWRFGYCLPTRFMLTALPALVLPLARSVDRALNGSISLVFVLTLGGCLGWDGNREVLSLTEAAYKGSHLINRSIDQVYPAGIHFPLLLEKASVPWLDVVCWLAVSVLLFFADHGTRRLRIVLLAGSIVGISAIGRAQFRDRLDVAIVTAPSLRRFSSKDEENYTYSRYQKHSLRLRNGSISEGVRNIARPSDAQPGIIGEGTLPYGIPSVYTSTISHTAAQHSDESLRGYYVLTKRYSVPAQTNHETRYAVPITSGATTGFVRFVMTSDKALMYHYVTYRGQFELEFGDASVVRQSVLLQETHNLEFSRTLDLTSSQGDAFLYGFVVVGLENGFYRANVVVEDVDPLVWVARQSDPLVTLIFSNVTDLADGQAKALAWYPMTGKPLDVAVEGAVERPSVEAYLSPFWTSLPFTDQTCIDFEIDKTQTVYMAVSYSGEHDLTIKSIDLFRRSFTSRVDGSSFVLPDKPAGL